MKTKEYWHHVCQRAVDRGQIWAEEYRRGAIIHGWPPRSHIKVKAENRPPRGIIKSQSARSLIRAAFAISNSPTDWEVMITLTFRTAHPFAKDCLRTFMSDCWPDGVDRWEVCWFQEYQKRGVVHYHILTTLDALAHALPGQVPTWEQRGRGGAARTVLGGDAGWSLALRWCAIIGDTSSAAVSFNVGGMVEKLSNPEDSGRYMSSYAKKLSQKTLPDDECPQGRWWYMSEVSRPIRLSFGRLEHYPLDKPHRLVYDKLALAKKGGEVENESDPNHVVARAADPAGPAGARGVPEAPGSRAGGRRYSLEVVGNKVSPKPGQAGRSAGEH